LKMKTQATTTMLNFCQGLQNSEEDEENDVDGADILNQYVPEILKVLGPNLNEGIQKKHQPLQIETLMLISTVAEVVGDDFSQYFNDFVTPLKIGVGIPQPTENSVEDKSLAA